MLRNAIFRRLTYLLLLIQLSEIFCDLVLVLVVRDSTSVPDRPLAWRESFHAGVDARVDKILLRCAVFVEMHDHEA